MVKIMGAGKTVSIAGGILTIIATYVLCWYTYVDASVTYYVYGIGGLFRLPVILGDIATASADYSFTNPISIYIMIVLMIIFLISGILQAAGSGKRAVVIVGSLLPLAAGIVIGFSGLLGVEILENWAVLFNVFGTPDALVAGIIPFDYPMSGVSTVLTSSLGTYVLIAGGVLGLIGGIMGRDD